MRDVASLELDISLPALFLLAFTIEWRPEEAETEVAVVDMEAESRELGVLV